MSENPYRHPAGRTCGGVIAMWTVLGAVLALLRDGKHFDVRQVLD